MPRLSEVSLRAIERLRNYSPPSTCYWTVPLANRAAVLILLFADRRGDLRVLVTIRSSSLNTYSGHAAFPGGHAEPEESPWKSARREAFEEIGLPNLEHEFPKPFWIEKLCELPAYMPGRPTAVRPCVALLHSYDDATGLDADAEEAFMLSLDAKEVAAVFTAPFHNFLKTKDEEPDNGTTDGPDNWYEGLLLDWEGRKWNTHTFYVPIVKQKITLSCRKSIDGEDIGTDSMGEERFRIWGMTARIMVDAAKLAYDEEPEFEHKHGLGEEATLERFLKEGRFTKPRRKAVDNSINTKRNQTQSLNKI